jgi:hypothetical protein
VDSDRQSKNELDFLARIDSPPRIPDSIEAHKVDSVAAAYKMRVMGDPHSRRPLVWPTLLVSVLAIPFAALVAGAVMFWAVAADTHPELLRNTAAFEQSVNEFVATPRGLYVLILPGQIVFITVALGAACFSREPLVRRLGLVPGRLPVWTWFVFAVATPVVGFLTQYVLSLFLQESGARSEQTRLLTEAFQNQSGWQVLSLILVIAVLPGTVEELLFRGYLQRRLLSRWPAVAAIGVTSLLFAVAHFDPLHIVAVLPLGCWLGVVAWQSQSTLPCILCHFSNNLMAALGMLAAGDESSLPEMESQPPLGFLAASVVILMTAMFVMVMFARTRHELDVPDDHDKGGPLPRFDDADSGTDGLASDAAAQSSGSGEPESEVEFSPDSPRPPVGTGE